LRLSSLARPSGPGQASSTEVISARLRDMREAA